MGIVRKSSQVYLVLHNFRNYALVGTESGKWIMLGRNYRKAIKADNQTYINHFIRIYKRPLILRVLTVLRSLQNHGPSLLGCINVLLSRNDITYLSSMLLIYSSLSEE